MTTKNILAYYHDHESVQIKPNAKSCQVDNHSLCHKLCLHHALCSCHILSSDKKWYLSSEYTFWCIVNELKPLLKEKSEFRGILQTESKMKLISKTLIIEIIFHRYWNDRSYNLILENIYTKYELYFNCGNWLEKCVSMIG